MSAQADIPAAVENEACPESIVGVPAWSDAQLEAWVGFHSVHQRVTRHVEQALAGRHGIGISGYKLLARLARAEQGHLRMSELADDALLSPSRVSRLVDEFERAGYVERRPCPSDSRVVHAQMTTAGLDYLAEVHETYVDAVERGFFDQLSEREVKALARVWSRLADA